MAQAQLQHQVLIELLAISGEISVPRAPDSSLLWKTIKECQKQGWISVTFISATSFKIELADGGQSLVGKSSSAA